ncbi:MAG TPA: glycosyltransferase [Myxococcales bacterium]|jgi:glycosyltransferase involved in cell wall biosynthesis
MRAEREVERSDPRPRVLQLVNTFHLGGTEGQVVELLRGLDPWFRLEVGAIDVRGPHAQTVERLGLEPLELPLSGSFFRPGTLRQIARLAAHLRREKVALLHAHDFYTTLLAVPAARLAGVCSVVGRLDLGHWHSKGQALALAAATRAADAVVANAEAIRLKLIEREHLPPDRVRVIHNGIDLQAFDRSRVEPLEEPLPQQVEGRVVIAHVANMTHPVKAQEDLLEAMVSLRQRHPEALLLLVGDGVRRPRLEAMAQRLGLGDSVCFLGRRGGVPAILARCHVGVLCSHAEGLSNAIIEGMAAGLPMVVTDAGGNAELVKDGERGFVVPVRSPLPLADRLGALVGNAELRRSMGQAGRAYVERELTLRSLLENHAALYRDVLSARAERRSV